MSAGAAPSPEPPLLEELVLARVVRFAELLREAGLAVSVGETAGAIQALAHLQPQDDDDLYWGLRMALAKDQEEIERFDRIFRSFWLSGDQQLPRPSSSEDGTSGDTPAPSSDLPTEPEAGAGESPAGEPVSLRISRDGGDGGEEGKEPTPFPSYSAAEVLRTKNFADYDEDDRRRLEEELEQLGLQVPQRLSRRYQRSPKGALDIRRTMVDRFRTDGYPIRRRYHRRRPVPRPITFVCDVSGSMANYATPVLLLAREMARRQAGVRTFAFATRLHELTAELAEDRVGQALEAAVERVVDWSGGTRIGECVAELNRIGGRVLRGAVLVIASDGWDLGDPSLLSSEMERLRLQAHQIIWLNPNLQDARFEPLTRGMASALPFVDQLVSCHQYASFESLLDVLAADRGRRVPAASSPRVAQAAGPSTIS